MSGWIQVAGIRNRAEAGMLVAAGVDWLGFPFHLDVHTEDSTEAAAAEIIAALPAHVRAVLITYLSEAADILDLMQRLGTSWVQLHGPVRVEVAAELRRQQADIGIIKSLVIRPDNDPDLETTVSDFAAVVDAFITDTFDPTTGASGATGMTHDWRISRRLVALSPRPVILAGGLTAANVRSAIQCVRPAGVDVHTGVEDRDGRKDVAQVRAFVREARAGFGDWLRAGPG